MEELLEDPIAEIRGKVHAAKSVGVLCELYFGIHDAIKVLESFKKYILSRIEKVLFENNREWGECDVATFGITDPKPKAGVDEDAWREAMSTSETLASLQEEYERSRKAFLVDKTPSRRPFIKRKKAK